MLHVAMQKPVPARLRVAYACASMGSRLVSPLSDFPEHPMTISISLTVNGKAVSADIDPRMLLAQFLREHLHLTGTHIGCDTGHCGACTVHLDGRAVKACNILAAQAQGAKITTIEGINGTNGDLHPMQAAFREHHGLQCGFCTPGMVMSCAHLVERNPDCNLDDVRDAIGGHLCRCGAYPNIFKATLAAAAAMRQRKDGDGT
jgi:carbon-monoxide dehydrogenase small subunit